MLKLSGVVIVEYPLSPNLTSDHYH